MMGEHGGPGMMDGGSPGWSGPRKFTSNGEQIYYTGISGKSGPIRRIGGPPWVQHIGGGCVASHGVRGLGGAPVMMGTAIPEDIRHKTLTSPHDHEEAEKSAELDHPLYTDALIKRAINQGVDPGDQSLDWTMPRWQMTDQDLNDLLAYLKTLR
ncbi:MAG TPA: c-type cytochrome [Candidatus Methylomirabilis sp.]|nr:c-type cytochrome [Candidatus Methylomirabilis sp.]